MVLLDALGDLGTYVYVRDMQDFLHRKGGAILIISMLMYLMFSE